MKLFKPLQRTLSAAIDEGLVSVRGISGKSSWQGLDIALENHSWLHDVEISIPAETTFQETSGQYQTMMSTQAATIYVPRRRMNAATLDNVRCTQPREPVPPPLLRPPTPDMIGLSSKEISDPDFIRTIDVALATNAISEELAGMYKIAREELRKDPHWEGFRIEYTYKPLEREQLSAAELADQYLGIAVNEYVHGNKGVVEEMLKKAAEIAPTESTAPSTVRSKAYYRKLARIFNGDYVLPEEESLKSILYAASGTDDERSQVYMLLDVLQYKPRREYPRGADRKAVNSHLAGQWVTSKRDPNIRVYYKENGYPDFTPFAAVTVILNEFTSYHRDFHEADKLAGFTPSNPKPTNHTWHHHEDGKTMQLIPTKVNDEFKHTGGNAYRD